MIIIIKKATVLFDLTSSSIDVVEFCICIPYPQRYYNITKVGLSKLKWKHSHIKHCDCAMADNEKSERKEKEQHQDIELASWRKKI
jgi:hypothetical protein